MSLLAGRLICQPVEQLVNAALRYDPAVLAKLEKLIGLRMSLHVTQIGYVFVLFVEEGISLSFIRDNLSAGNSSEGHSSGGADISGFDADVTLTGSVSDFIRLATADDKAHELINSDIDMTGDTELAMTVTRIFQSLDIDWEAMISPLTGGVVAHLLGQQVRNAFKWYQQTSTSYRRATKSYLEDEREILTPAPLMNRFNRQVDDLRLACDRLKARVDLISNASSNEAISQADDSISRDQRPSGD